jgi:glutamine synthetase
VRPRRRWTTARWRRRRGRSCGRSRPARRARLASDAGTELEFLVFRDTYEDAQRKHYADLVPANLYNIDYSLLGTARIEPLLRRIRNSMAGAGMVVESVKGECNLGQQEIGFLYDEALVTCDNHSVYKTGAKEIASQDGVSSPSWRSTTPARATRATSTSAW